MRNLTIALLFAFLVGVLGSCVVRTRGHAAGRGGCGAGYYKDNGRCYKKGKKKHDKHGDHRDKGDDVKVRDHRR